MKSSNEQLKNRGYVTVEDINVYVYSNKNELLELLKSKEPYKRTIAIKLLSNKNELDNEMINLFCTMLLYENKLYTKMELCNALSKASVKSAKIMINYLGLIGKNQYTELPSKEFNKKSYPLPRDIIARTLAHMSVDVLPELIKTLKTNNIITIREAIDSIGFICFYNYNSYSENILDDLISCFNEHITDDIVRWKIVRAFESFNSKTVMYILINIKENDSNSIIRNEAKRSLDIINSKFTF
ncbi:hypothetical protein [Clostridium uliginosum]|uniref:HEAT repeat-containing protein n=1 Tax=Clostridium uliginosum TaxID=119641 RepID=A0A1I1N4Z7_9CLOT|nr:hypothetical protein [Clostridium uliginosum]SFC92262.1 hypothetical protein SAMN05421842_11380 [Clostridium uliginosum]